MPFRYGRIEDLDDDEFELRYWLEVSDVKKFEYVDRLVSDALMLQGKSKNELRLQRTLGTLQRQER